MKTKFLSALLAITMVFGLTACDDSSSSNSKEDNQTTTTVNTDSSVDDTTTTTVTKPPETTTVTTTIVTTTTVIVTTPEPEPELTESEYKKQCKSIDYKKIARDVNGLEGEYFKFTGEIVQDCGDSSYRINVTKSEYGYYSDTILFFFDTGSGDRILEGDIVTIWGVSDGLYTYETVLGSEVTLPGVFAEYMEIK